MLIINLIIVCLPFCFCRELQNPKVEGFFQRLKRASEKGRLIEPKRPRKDNLKFNLQLAPTSTGLQAKQSNLPRLVPVITKTILNNNIKDRKEPVNKSPISQLFQAIPCNFTPVKTKPNEVNKPINEVNKFLKSNKTHNSTSTVQPKLFTEDPEVDDKPTDRPQSTTQSQNVDTQIEKPMDKESSEKLPTDMLADNENSENSEKIGSRATKWKKLKDSKIKCKTNHQQKFNKVNKTNDSKSVSSSVYKKESPLSWKESEVVKEPVVTKSEDNSAKHKVQNENENDVQDNKKKKEQTNAENAIKSDKHILNKSSKDKTQNITKKLLKIVPSILPCKVLNKILLPPKGNNSIQPLEPTIQIPDKKMFSEDNANNNPKHINNENVNVIEVQHSHTEIVEKQSPTNDSITDDYPKSSQSYGQPFETQPENFYDTYKPDTTYTPPPYEYPYPNLNLDSLYSKTLENDSRPTSEAEKQKTTYRAWSDTKVFIEKSRNKPVEIQMTVRPTFQRPTLNNYYYNNNHYGYNRNAYYPTYSAYPYYYSKGCYALRNCY